MFNSYSKESFIDAVAYSASIRQVLIRLNVRPHGGNYRTAKKYIEKLKLNTSHFTGQSWNRGNKPGPKRPIEDYLSNKQAIQSYKLKKRLITDKIKLYQCEQCKITKWNNKPTPLELHHIDGNHKNNNLSNLQLLCPNCHHQTPNFRNTKSKRTHSAKTLNDYTRPKKQYFCIDCGKTKSRSAIRCRSCYNIKFNQTIRKRPEKNQLTTDINLFKGNKSAIARKYNVSTTLIRKWYKIYDIS